MGLETYQPFRLERAREKQAIRKKDEEYLELLRRKM
jgi:hypothetical protein